MELRTANKALLERLKKSQQEISQCIVTVKHSDYRVLDDPLTSTLMQRNKYRSSRIKNVSFQPLDNSLSKKRSNLRKRLQATPKAPASSPPRNVTFKNESKSPITSRFLQNKLAKDGYMHSADSTNDASLLQSPGNCRPFRKSSDKKSNVVSLSSKLDDEQPVQAVFKTPDNLEEVKQFRKLYRSECHSSKHWSELLKTPKTPVEKLSPWPLRETHQKTPDPSDTRDPRIINFTVNKRIFPVPVDPSENIPPGSDISPRYIRVSIPKSSLKSPYHYVPNQRQSLNDGFDSLSLPDHCVMGWQNTVPKRIERNRRALGLDLRSSLRPKENLVSLQLKSGQASIPVKNDVKDRSFYDTLACSASS